MKFKTNIKLTLQIIFFSQFIKMIHYADFQQEISPPLILETHFFPVTQNWFLWNKLIEII